MRLGVPKETLEHEARVALVPDMLSQLIDMSFEVHVEAGAGEGALCSDTDYGKAGACVEPDGVGVFEESDVVVKVQPPTPAEVARLKEDSILISLLQPVRNHDIVVALNERRITAISMYRVPRTSRAQPMDALSSQANIAGYKAVLLGAATLGKLLPMMVTAAGTIRPSKVFVLGAGVAGLQAIATARRLGAVVSAFDLRPAVKEQVESLGAKFLEVDLGEADTEVEGGYAKEISGEAHQREAELVGRTLLDVDIVISTALIPDRPAPTLITEGMVRNMRPGSVIVDLAAETGGNCELTEPGRTVVRHDVKIIGHLNLPSTVAVHSSQMYSRNIVAMVQELVCDGAIVVDLDNHVIGPCTITHAGEIRNA